MRLREIQLSFRLKFRVEAGRNECAAHFRMPRSAVDSGGKKRGYGLVEKRSVQIALELPPISKISYLFLDKKIVLPAANMSPSA